MNVDLSGLAYLGAMELGVIIFCVTCQRVWEAHQETRAKKEAKRRQLYVAKCNWLNKREEREDWLQKNPQLDDVQNHEFQKYVQAELGALCLYLALGGAITIADKNYFEDLVKKMDVKIVARLPSWTEHE